MKIILVYLKIVFILKFGQDFRESQFHQALYNLFHIKFDCRNIDEKLLIVISLLSMINII